MLLWVLIALLTAAAVFAVLLPLGRARDTAGAVRQTRQVYLDQLTELEREREQGRITDEAAEAARIEVARRLLSTEKQAGSEGWQGSQTARRAVAVLALAGIPLVSLSFYAWLGNPSLPAQPLAARLAEPGAPDDIAVLVAKVESHLAATPDDGRGWDIIAPVYLRLGRPADAVLAYRNAIRILGADSARQTGLGEALVTQSGGVVTAEAKAAFLAGRAADPKDAKARYFLALAAEQEGDLTSAAEGWRALLNDSPPDAPWRGPIERALARIDDPVPSGPGPDQVAAAQNLAPDEQAAMIQGMVSGLAQRLQTEPNDVEGWLRLIRSYTVLGQQDKAQEAARNALVGVQDTDARSRVERLIADLGLQGGAIP